MSVLKKINKSQVLRFLVVGGFCAGVEFLLFAVLVHYFKVGYLYANMASLLVAVLLNYLISRKHVFKGGRYSGRVEFSAFVLFSAIGVAMNQYLIWYFVEQAELHVNLSKMAAIALVAAFNYVTKKHIVFRN